MIPLHVADQAVAACDKEIAGLREEVSRLKAEVERLRQAGDRMAAALNGEYNHELPCVQDWNAAKGITFNPTQPNA